MSYKIQEMNAIQCFFLLRPKDSTSLATYYMNIILNGNGKAFALIEDDEIISYSLVITENDNWVISYVYTLESKRRKGYALKLLEETINRLDNIVRMHIASDNEYFDAIIACAKKLNFYVNDVSHISTVDLDENFWKGKEGITFESFHRMKELILGNKRKCISVKDLDDKLLSQLTDANNDKFVTNLNPSEMLVNEGYLVDKDLSTVLVEDGVVKAYVLITRPNSYTVGFEQISANEGEIGRGLVVAPLIDSVIKISKDPTIKKMYLTVSDNNEKALKLNEAILPVKEFKKIKNYSLIRPAKFPENMQISDSV